MKHHRLLSNLTLVLLSSSFMFAQAAFADTYSTYDTLKGKTIKTPHNLSFGGGKYLTGDDMGMLTIDEAAGTVNYQDRVQNASGTGGYDIELNLNIVNLATLTDPSAPRCADGNCNGPYYTANGIDPENDWLFLVEDTSKTNAFTEWGTLGSDTLSVSTKWGQFGDGGGGIRVLPEGLAFAVWFDGGGDLNVNTTATPEPSSVLLLGSGIAALAGWRRYRQQ